MYLYIYITYLVGSFSILEKFYITNSVVGTVDAIFPPHGMASTQNLNETNVIHVPTTTDISVNTITASVTNPRNELVFEVLDMCEQFILDL